MTDLTPGSPEWARRVSPSKAAVMLGLSPWDSPYSMWRKMRSEIPWDEETPAMERGTLCEPAVLTWWRKHHEHTDWREQVTLELDDWCVATPDALCVIDGQHVLVEAKTAADTTEWEVLDGPPVHYLTQVYLAMHVAHLNGIPVVEAHVPVLGGRRLLFSNYVVPYSAEHGQRILDLCREFYDSLDADEPPPLDDTPATYEAVRRLHPEIDRGESVELTREQADDLVTFTHLAKEAKRSLKGAQTVVLDAMGRAEYATHAGVRIARRQSRGDAPPYVVATAKPEDLTTEGSAA